MTLPFKSAVAIGINSSELNDWGIAFSMDELIELAKTAGIRVHGTVFQTRTIPHPRTYLGSGKLEEVQLLIAQTPTDLVIADDELPPSVQKRLEDLFGIPVVDRTGLILDIFAGRAKTHEAKLQVELAQLNYQLPRLTKMWSHFGRAGAGIGTKGMGETQLEVDKRLIGKRISVLKSKLEKVRSHRQSTRKKRTNTPVVTGSIVGYTNAGKSTLMNALTKSNVLSEDALFATLDPTSRRLYLDSHDPVVLTDTVGFIKKLPHQLVTSFRSTLEEAAMSDFIVHVVDVSHPEAPSLIQTAQRILSEIDADHIPILYVFNKIDRLHFFKTADLSDPDVLTTFKPESDPELGPILRLLMHQYTPHCWVSALNGLHLDRLKTAISDLLSPMRERFKLHLRYDQAKWVSTLRQYGSVVEEQYLDDHIYIEVDMIRSIGQKWVGALLR